MSLLILTACTDNSKDEVIDVLERELRTSRYELDSCNNQLSALNNGSSSTETPFNPQEETNEPQCEEVEYDEIHVDGRLLATCLSEDVKLEACGIKAQNCKGDYSYFCLQNVKLKTITDKECK